MPRHEPSTRSDLGPLASTDAPGIQGTLARIAEIQAQAGIVPGSAPEPARPAGGAFDEVLARSMAAPAPPSSAGGAPPAAGARAGSPPGAAGPAAPVAGPARLIGRPHQGTHTLGNWQSDNAIDLAVPVGTPVYAVEDGRIGSRIGPLASTASRFAGERLTLEGAGGNAYYYAHLSRLAVGAGQEVRRGQLLGWSGSANGVPHLHLGVRSGDPVALIAAS